MVAIPEPEAPAGGVWVSTAFVPGAAGRRGRRPKAVTVAVNGHRPTPFQAKNGQVNAP